MKVLSRLIQTGDGELTDRSRLYGYTACLVGVPILLVTITSIWMLGEADHYLLISGIIAVLTLFAIGISTYMNNSVEKTLGYALLVTYINIWVICSWEILAGDHKQHHLAVLLFIPLITVSLLRHRIIFTLMPIQFLLVYFASTEYAGQYFSTEFSQNDIVIIGILFAIMSCVSFFMSAITARIREINDAKFLAVIDEKKALALTDPLTGLKNRRALIDAIETSWGRQGGFVLAFMDLDRFKPINDQYGHTAGDELLSEIANRLSAAEDVEFAARLGGDEFAFILKPGLSGQQADLAVKLIHDLLTKDVKSSEATLSFGTSIGYVENNDDVASSSLMLPAAEIAMRRAKQNRSGWERFNRQIDNATMATGVLEIAFKKALMDGQICAAVQPIACAQSYKIVGYELLARWANSGLKEDPRPDQFIPIAEKLGLLNELLWATLNEALAASDKLVGTLSINVSPAQITASDFIPKLVEVLKSHNFPRQRIVLEVTEEVMFRNVSQNIQVLKEARRLGMTIALDDFGKGYSSLSIVEKLPLDKLKIDRSLVFDLAGNNRMRAILEVALEMANKLDLESCVEGIESKADAQEVAKLGAKQIQGFWLGKPQLVSRMDVLERVA